MILCYNVEHEVTIHLLVNNQCTTQEATTQDMTVIYIYLVDCHSSPYEFGIKDSTRRMDLCWNISHSSKVMALSTKTMKQPCTCIIINNHM